MSTDEKCSLRVGRLATVVAIRLIRALKRLGWTEARQAGSHLIMRKEGFPPLPIPVHKGRNLKEGTVRSILKMADISEDEFFEDY
jgi:predicted RNA binding protein YcfA (HicA-like mRNA interferase family)